jgi:tight adherence protein B
MDIKFNIFIVFVFIAAFFALEALYYWWSARFGAESTRLKRRIASIANHDLDRSDYDGILKNRYAAQSDSYNQFLINLPFVNKLDELLMQSGKLWTVAKLFRISGIAMIVAFVLGMVLNFNFSLLLPIAFAAASLPLVYLFRAREQRFRKFEEQLPEAIDSICRSLRAGHAFTSAFSLVGQEMADPIAAEFRIAMEENNLGMSINDAMHNLAKRVPLTDLRFFVIAVLVQRETGGNLAEILGNISTIVRDRFKLLRHIRVLTAEGRLSALILALMPFIMVALLSALNPTYAPTLFSTPTGQYFIKVGLVMMLIGIIWMRNIVNIKM